MILKNPRRWLLISREMGIPFEEGGGNWMSVDHLFLDQDGIPTFVEVKRSSDTRIRREVVGQMLDYAANAVKNWPPETILEHFESNYAGEDPGNTLAEIFGEEDLDVDDYWEKVKSNLRVGKVRMIFVADVIPPELQRIVEFLYEQMSPAEVLAVEIKQYAGEDIKTLVPRVLGKTAQKSRPSGPKRKWNEEMFFNEIEEKNGIERTEIARKIFKWVNSQEIDIWWGEGKELGSFVPRIFHDGIKHQLFAVYTSGGVEIYFQWYQYKKPFDDEEKRKLILNKLNEIEGVNLPEDSINRRPSIDLLLFDTEEKIGKIYRYL